MAAGVPVVASRSGGILDVIEDGVHGLLAKPGNISDLAETVVRMWHHERKDRMVQNARNRVADRFSWDSVADRFADLYADLIQGGGRPNTKSAG
jgi:1,4-alpha-glucan branching enzyme